MFAPRTSSLSSLLSLEKLRPDEKNYLKAVYGTLTAGVVATAVGGFSYLNYLALPPLLCMLGSVGLGFYVMLPESSPAVKGEAEKKKYAFGAAAFLMGQSMGPLLELCLEFYPGVIQTALIATFSIFTCLSLAALFAEDRSWLYLGGVLSSTLMYLFMVSLCNMFFRSRIAHAVEMYVGLLVYMGFVLYDTQVTLEAYRCGDRNITRAAMRFLTDVISLFLRIVRILMEMQNRNREKQREKRRE